MTALGILFGHAFGSCLQVASVVQPAEVRGSRFVELALLPALPPQVLPGVATLVAEVQVEGTFKDGTKLVTVHSPIARKDGDLALALKGSFFPVPDLAVFGAEEDEPSPPPGEVVTRGPPLLLNAGRRAVKISVTNLADRPIQARLSPFPALTADAAYNCPAA